MNPHESAEDASAADDRFVAECLVRWEESLDQGNELSADELVGSRSHLTAPLIDQIAILRKMRWMDNTLTDGDLSAPIDLMVGTTLRDRYVIECVVGQGGFGIVYRAFDQKLRRSVAIKIAKRAVVDHSNKATADLLDEARAVARLRHPGIVAIHDVDNYEIDSGTGLFFVSELIVGQTIRDWLDEAPIDVSDAIDAIKQICNAIGHAHQEGFVHRDIKPSNLLREHSGRVLVTDFGIAVTLDAVSQSSAGTLPYMAPEQLADQTHLVDHRVDLHAIAVVFYELLTGRHPFDADSPAKLQERILLQTAAAPSEINPLVGPNVDAACLKSLAKHPDQRFKSADEMSTAIVAAGQLDRDRDRSLVRSQRLGMLTWLPWIMVAGLTGLFFWQVTTSPPLPATQSSPPVAKPLRFDGGNRIVTKLERFAPVTLEAWIRLDYYTDRPYQWIFGSDITGRYGIGLLISPNVLGASIIPEQLPTEGQLSPEMSDAIVIARQWTHVAGVFGQTETRLYYDGRLVRTGTPTRGDGGTRFVISTLGEESILGPFYGEIRDVRITRGERYKAGFIADEVFTNDGQDVVLLMKPTETADGIIRDESGYENHGIFQRFSDR